MKEKNMQKKRRFTFLTRIMLLALIPLITMSIALNVYSLSSVASRQEKALERNLCDIAVFATKDFRAENPLEELNAVATVKKATGFSSAVYCNGEITACNFSDKEKVEQACANSKEIEQVIKTGKGKFVNNIALDDCKWNIYVAPMRNDKEVIVGALLLGEKSQILSHENFKFNLYSGIITVILIIVVAINSFLLVQA